MLSHKKTTYEYQLLENTSEIEETFIDSFIDVSQYNNFALTHANGYVHMFDFIKGSQKISYGDVIKYVENLSNDTFYIMLNVSQCYCKQDGRFRHDYKTAEISPKDLLTMLNEQKKDMQGEKLCYVNDIDRTYCWDMMIFNRTYQWCFAVTHEVDSEGKRLCFMAKAI